ncbi:putative dNA polymerase subunit III (Alpha) dnaE2 [Mycobacterium intracellulare]|nr:putative dNA polymerase subunit III (Alpha) dnaE2 [Mycobacterium intracellulare]
MGWFNGPPSWAEMERVLDSKPRRAGEPAGLPEDAPLSRKRATYRPPGTAGHPARPSAVPFRMPNCMRIRRSAS